MGKVQRDSEWGQWGGNSWLSSRRRETNCRMSGFGEGSFPGLSTRIIRRPLGSEGETWSQSCWGSCKLSGISRSYLLAGHTADRRVLHTPHQRPQDMLLQPHLCTHLIKQACIQAWSESWWLCTWCTDMLFWKWSAFIISKTLSPACVSSPALKSV